MTSSLVRYAVTDGCAVLTLSRPDRRNALTRAMMSELLDAGRRAAKDPVVRAVILAAEGPAFCAGMDLAEMLETRRRRDARRLWRADAAAYRALLEAFLDHPRPVIAAVNGAAVAGGAGLVLAADVVVASEAAGFGVPEVRRGLAAGLVEPLLAFRAGAGTAAHLLLTGRILDAAECLARGLFHEVVAPAGLAARARALAGEVARGAPGALAASKAVLRRLPGRSLRRQLAEGARLSADARGSDEAAEGLTAFLEKREPRWPAPRTSGRSRPR